MSDAVPTTTPLVVRSPDVLGGAWRLRGTRIPISALRSFAAAGYSPGDIATEYPGLAPVDIAAALQWKEPATHD
jgi:uncharacterized protein (DUF433 family)